jgi:hypothetical protein
MPKNKVNDLITDQEINFAHLVLSGTMTDRRAAEAVGLNPDTAAYTKAKPRVREYMLEHRAAVNERLVQQQTEEARRLNLGRERVLARLWEIADMDPERTRNSMSAQIKAVSMIVAIEGLIPDRNKDRRAVSVQNKSVAPPVHPFGVTADAPADPGPTPGPDLNSSDSPAETTPSTPDARVPDYAQGNQVPSSVEKKPDTLRLRL